MRVKELLHGLWRKGDRAERFGKNGFKGGHALLSAAVGKNQRDERFVSLVVESAGTRSGVLLRLLTTNTVQYVIIRFFQLHSNVVANRR